MTLHTYPDLEQGSDAWLEARRGILTASTIGTLITEQTVPASRFTCPECNAEPEHPCVSRARKTPTPIKTIHPARTDLALSSGLTELAPATGITVDALTFGLAAERITGIVEPVYVNADMQRGHDEEPRARDYYTEHHAPATEYGFMVRELDDGTRVGYSPDGIVGEHGLIEAKAPRQKTHLRTILAGTTPAEHMAQMQCGMWVSGRDWCDFISFYGGMPVFVQRVHASTEWANAIEAVARRFEQQVTDITECYTDRTAGLPVTERISYDIELSNIA